MFPCIFDLTTKSKDLATLKAIERVNATCEDITKYINPASTEYQMMVKEIGTMIGFTTLKFQTLENMIRAVVEAPNNRGLKREDLCQYCWTGQF
jgi:amidophosphoribosyltransferase